MIELFTEFTSKGECLFFYPLCIQSQVLQFFAASIIADQLFKNDITFLNFQILNFSGSILEKILKMQLNI